MASATQEFPGAQFNRASFLKGIGKIIGGAMLGATYFDRAANAAELTSANPDTERTNGQNAAEMIEQADKQLVNIINQVASMAQNENNKLVQYSPSTSLEGTPIEQYVVSPTELDSNGYRQRLILLTQGTQALQSEISTVNIFSNIYIEEVSPDSPLPQNAMTANGNPSVFKSGLAHLPTTPEIYVLTYDEYIYIISPTDLELSVGTHDLPDPSVNEAQSRLASFISNAQRILQQAA